MTTVVGIDLSLTGTGICTLFADHVGPPDAARISHPLQATVTRYGTPPAGGDLGPRGDRLRRLVSGILARTGRPDLAVIEAPALHSKTGHAHDRSGAWWLLVSSLQAAGIPVAEASPQTVKKYATGKGNAGKDAVLAETVRRYGHLIEVNTNDEADAVHLAALGWHHLTGEPLIALPAQYLQAIATMTWPNR